MGVGWRLHVGGKVHSSGWPVPAVERDVRRAFGVGSGDGDGERDDDDGSGDDVLARFEDISHGCQKMEAVEVR